MMFDLSPRFRLPSVSRTETGRIDTPLKIYLQSAMAPDVTQAVEEVYRSDWGRIVATLIRLVGDFEVAEEAAQEAFTAAVDQWRVTGVPEFPRAWIIQTARHKAIDRLRRVKRQNQSIESYAASGLGSALDEPNYDNDKI